MQSRRTVGSYAINVSASGTDLGNYRVTTVNGRLAITKANLVIAATSAPKVYGTTASLAYTETGLVNSDTITSVTKTSSGTSATAAVGTYAIDISAAVGTGLSNYTVKYSDGTLTVPGELDRRGYQHVQGLRYNATLKYTETGLVNSDAINSVTETSSGASVTAVVANSPYTIDISAAVGTGLSNYAIKYTDGALTVTPATASVTVTHYTVTYNNAAHTATGVANGVFGSLPSSDLKLTGTTHTSAGTYTDTWTFSDPDSSRSPERCRMSSTRLSPQSA